MEFLRQKIIIPTSFTVLVAALVFLPRQLSADSQTILVQVDPLAKILHETSLFNQFDRSTEVAIGEIASFQFVLRSPYSLKEVTMYVSPLTNMQGDTLRVTRKGFVGYVGVGKLAPERANDVVPSASRLYPDPIVEKTSMNVKARCSQPLWIDIDIPYTTKPGSYTGKVTVRGQQGNHTITQTCRMHLTVYPVKMDEPKLYISNMASLNSFLKSYDHGWEYAPHYSDLWIETLRQTALKMKEAHSNTVCIPPLDYVRVTFKNNRYSFDFSLLDRVIEVFRIVGVLRVFEGGHIAERSGGWESNFLVKVPQISKKGVVWQKHPISSAVAKRFYSQLMPAIYQHLRQNYPNVEYLQHIGDEPIDTNAKSYREIATYIKKYCPNIKLIEACQTVLLGNIIDVWVPSLDFYHKHYAFFRQQQAKGKQVWFYTAYLPQANYANRFIELPTLKTRLLHWLNFKYGSTGYLHWGFNRWVGNPYQETIQDMGGGIILPGGDSWIVYPSESVKLYSSLRLSAMRDGIADYTLLKMLQDKDPQRAIQLCDNIIKDWDSYETDLVKFRNIRHQLLTALCKTN